MCLETSIFSIGKTSLRAAILIQLHSVPFVWNRSRRSQPARRRLRQRTAIARCRPPADRRTGPQRRPALRHLPTAPSLPRMRLQDTIQVNNEQFLFFIYDVLFYINIGPSVRPLELTMGKTFCFSDEEASSSFSPEFERSINRSMLDSLLNLYKHCCQGGSFLAHRRWETYTNELLVIRRTWLNPVKTM